MPRDTSARRSWITFVAMSLGVLPLALITLGIPGAEGLPESLWERLAAQRTTAAGYRATDAVDERGEQDGGESMTWEERMRRLLDAIPTDHDVLINVSAGEMPGTSDLTRLGRRATPALARALLNNMNDDVRAICAGILGEIRDPAATEALVLALEDSVPSVRFAAAGSLGSLGDTRYAQRLMAMITNPEEEEWVKGAAIDALGRIGAPGSFDLLLRLVHSERYLGLQGSIINALWLARGSVSRGKLIAVFIDVLRKDEPAAGTVIAYLGWLQAADAVKPLADYYVGRADWVKNSIVLAMGRIGTPAARTFLRAVMMDPQKVRHINNAAIALADMGDREWVVENLASLLADRRVYFRINAAFALGEVGASSPAALAALALGLRDPNDFVKSESAVALGRLKDARATDALLAAAGDPNPFVQLDAIIALNRIDYAAHNHLIFEKLLVHTKPDYRRIRDRGILFLAEAGDERAVPWILASMRDGTYEGWERAFRMLEDLPRFDHDVFAPALLQAVMSQGYSSAGAAALSLIRERVVKGLSRYLMEAVYHAWVEQKKRIYLTLGKVADPGDLGTIKGIPEQDDAVMLYQDFALANLGQAEALDRLLAVLRDGAMSQKRDAAFLLGFLEKPIAREKLGGLLRNEDRLTAINAAYALLPHGADEAYQLLYDVMRTASPALAQEAERTLRVSPAEGIVPFLKARLAKEGDLIMKQRLSTLLYEKEPREFR